MSKLVPGGKQETCKTWQAPSFASNTPASGAGLHTHQQNETIRQQAYDEGFARGVQDGMAQSLQQMQERIAQLDNIMHFMTKPLEQLDERVLNELGELAMLVAGQLVRRELKASPGEVVATIKEAIELLPVASGRISLELHPDDAAIVMQALSGVDKERSWDIVEDPLLSRGGCRVSTSDSRIDATVESRLNAAIVAVMGCERKETP